MLPTGYSYDNTREAAYLVARGVRAYADVGGMRLGEEGDYERIQDAYAVLLRISSDVAGGGGRDVIPVLVASSKGDYAYAGFAARPWVVDLLKWMDANMPGPYVGMVFGLLYGYSADAIAEFIEKDAGHP